MSEGRVATRRPDEPVQERTDRVRVALELLLAVAESWTSPVPPAERAAANVRRDPNPDVRLGNLTALLRDTRQDPVVPSVLEGALTDADPEVRLTAAVASGRGGREALRAFLADASTRDEPAARAIDALGGERGPRGGGRLAGPRPTGQEDRVGRRRACGTSRGRASRSRRRSSTR